MFEMGHEMFENWMWDWMRSEVEDVPQTWIAQVHSGKRFKLKSENASCCEWVTTLVQNLLQSIFIKLWSLYLKHSQTLLMLSPLPGNKREREKVIFRQFSAVKWQLQKQLSHFDTLKLIQ